MANKPSIKHRTLPHPDGLLGFTLLEILVAMAILGIVVSLVFGSFSAVFYNSDSITEDSDLIEMGNACLKRMELDLTSLHVQHYPRYKPPGIDDDNPDSYRIVGTEQMLGGQSYAKLRFASLAHLPLSGLPGESIAEITYYVQRTEQDHYVIRRADKTYPYPEQFEENEKDPVMCENVKGFKIIYYDNDGDEHEEWNSESDDADYSTPKSMGIELVVGTEEREFHLKTEISLPMVRYKKVKV